MKNLLYIRYPKNQNELRKFFTLLEIEWKNLSGSSNKRERSKILARIIKSTIRFREDTINLIIDLEEEQTKNPIFLLKKKLKLDFYRNNLKNINKWMKVRGIPF